MNKGRSATLSAQPDPKAGTGLRDRVRAIVQVEVAQAEPADTARRSLELIVETAVRAREENGHLHLTIVDDGGEPRSRVENGRSVPLTLAEYIEELRHKHPTLFKARRAEPMPAAAAPLAAAAPAIAEPAMDEPRQGSSRDWLDLGGSAEVRAAPLAKPRPVGAAKARFGSVLQMGASALGAVRPAIFQAMDRLRAASARRPARTAEPIPAIASVVRPRRWLPVAGAAAAFAALLVGSALVIPGLMNPGDAPARQLASAPATAAPPADPVTTGTVAQNSPPPASGSLRGVPEVLDTTTLRLQDRVVRLFGVEWARGGGDPDDLVKYLRGREVSCAPAATAESFRCQVEGQDLSRVVLFNGGGRATSDATPELRTAEEHARSARLGVWRESRAPGP